MLRRWAGNSVWTLVNGAHALAVARNERHPRVAQERWLARFLRRNARSAYGQAHGYAEIRGIEEFQDRVPLVSYADLEPWVDRIRNGEPRVLTPEPVLCFEKTSGSSGGAKYIPYTRTLLEEFRRAVGSWLFDLFRQRPALLGGSQYWALTPAVRTEKETPGGLPIGFGQDAEYFSRFERRLLASIVETPPGIVDTSPDAPPMDAAECLERTARHLSRCRDLRFVSVWSPSFLLLLLDALESHGDPSVLWPELRVVSCWTAGDSAHFLPEIERRLPGVEIQGKGLLATEGVVSVPRLGSRAPVPAWSSHFLEFLDDKGDSRGPEDLEVGRRYSVAITTGGGFARYRLRDRIEVVAPPSERSPGAIEFVGREGRTSDVAGEKLGESFVQEIIDAASRRHSFVGLPFLAPEAGHPPHYVLMADTPDSELLARFVEARLRRSHHYDYCRRLGQLGPVEGVAMKNIGGRFLNVRQRRGQRLGEIKPTCLGSGFGWRERLTTC